MRRFGTSGSVYDRWSSRGLTLIGMGQRRQRFVGVVETVGGLWELGGFRASMVIKGCLFLNGLVDLTLSSFSLLLSAALLRP